MTERTLALSPAAGAPTLAYEQIEEIQSRKGEKIAMFLTLENATGLILGAFPAYLISAAMPFFLRIAIVLAAAVLGVVVTLDMGGMAGYERLIWLVRGTLRRRVDNRPIAPESLAGAVVTVRWGRPLPVGGPIQLRPTPVPRTLSGSVPLPQPRPVAVVITPDTPPSSEAPDVRLPAQQLPD